MRLRVTCVVCGKAIEKTWETPAQREIAKTMITYLARRHREKTGHDSWSATVDVAAE